MKEIQKSSKLRYVVFAVVLVCSSILFFAIGHLSGIRDSPSHQLKDYTGYKVIRITPRHSEDVQFIKELQRKHAVREVLKSIHFLAHMNG